MLNTHDGYIYTGGEKETIESTRKLIRASIDMGLDDAEYSPLFVYPDTPLYDKYFKNPKEWFSVVLNATEPWGEVVYENNKLRKEDLISLIDEAYQDFYQSRAMIKHVKDRYRLKGEKMKSAIDRLFDRLYGQMTFPSIIVDLLDCPGLLRLRDVRMANNQFYAFPAFANSSRYEHSLGVCYLAGLCADSMQLAEKDKIELMIAGLYHDVGTPPFAHAMEEVLMALFGFDHEENLKNLITGDTGEFDQDFAQVYLGKSLKLKSVCQNKKARSLGVDPHRIARIAVGDKSDELAPLINGSGMDLDNIDNICRAVSAMGIMEEQLDFAELAAKLASSFVLDNGKIFTIRNMQNRLTDGLRCEIYSTQRFTEA